LLRWRDPGWSLIHAAFLQDPFWTAEWVTVLLAEVAMKTENRSALPTLLRTLTDAELHDLLVAVQTELLNRPAHQDGLVVEVLSAEEAALVGRYRRLPPRQRKRLQTTVSRTHGRTG
jgi:hypothetical protein